MGPDSGYSWVIVGASAYIHFALFGLFRSAGVIYVAFLHNYGVSREDAAWPFSLCSAVFQLTGPLASLLTHYLTLRKSCLFGSAIATLGVACCYFADSILLINIFYGVIHGFGFGLVVTLIPVIINQYFVRYRTTAMGFSFSGGTVSSFVFPKFIEILIDTYGLRGSFLILGGFVMNTMVACALLRAPPWLKKKKKKHRADAVQSSYDPCEYRMEQVPDAKDSGVFSEFPCTQDIVIANISEINEVSDSVFSIIKNGKKDVTLDKAETEPLVEEKMADTDTKLEKLEAAEKNFETDKELDGYVENSCDNFKKIKHINEQIMNCDNSETDKAHSAFILDKKKIFIIPKKELALHNKVIDTQNKPPESNFSDLCQSVISILSHPMFHLMAFSINVFFLLLHSFFMVIVDFAKDKGIPEDTAIYILSVFSAMDLLGRIGFGWVTDHNFVSRKIMMMINLTFIGILTNIYPLVNTFIGICVVSSFHGLAVGSTITLFFVLFVEYLGMKKLALVLGISSFINGTLTFLRPAMTGIFRDVIGSYDWMFHFLGFLAFLTVCMWFAEPWLSKRGPIDN